MSGWDAYCALSAGGVSNCSIYGIDGGHWAGNFPGQDVNVKAIVAMNASGAPSSIKMGDVSYMFMRNMDGTLIFRKGGAGVVAAVTPKAVVLSYHNDSISSNQCVVATNKVSDALKAVGF